MFDPGLLHTLPKPKKIDFDSVIFCQDNVFGIRGGKPEIIGTRQTICKVIGAGINGFAKVEVLACSGTNPYPIGTRMDWPVHNLLKGGLFDHSIQDGSIKLKSGGHLEGFQNGKKVILDEADKGGMSVGASHENGGIKGVVGTEARPIEFEGQEIILTASVANNPKKYNFEGQELTGREIASKINQDNGGVSFEKGGTTCSCSN